MNIRKYFEETTKKENELLEARQKLEQITSIYHDLRGICTHNIVFKYKSNYPHENKIDGDYYCPACRLVYECAKEGQILQTKFSHSRVIPIMNLSLRNGKNVQDAIRKEVYENIELYYNPDIPVDELSSKMEDAIKEQHFDYLNPNKVYKKI